MCSSTSAVSPCQRRALRAALKFSKASECDERVLELMRETVDVSLGRSCEIASGDGNSLDVVAQELHDAIDLLDRKGLRHIEKRCGPSSSCEPIQRQSKLRHVP